MEGGKGHGPLDESIQVAVATNEAMHKNQHQGTVGDRLAEVMEGVRRALHLAVVLPHREIPLRELVKLVVEVECPSISFLEELFLESELWSRMMSYRSMVMVPWSHERTTLSIRHHDGDGGATRSLRAWSARAYCRNVRRT
jgi:hypothetical protein